MHNRLNLHEKLVKILGSRNVYFQPPETIKMNYPCIVYERYDINNTHADDDVYLSECQYRVTVIDADPDSEVVEKISKLRKCRFIRHIVVDNLNHDTFSIYY